MKPIKIKLKQEILMLLCGIIKNNYKELPTDAPSETLTRFSILHDVYFKLLKPLAKPNYDEKEISVKLKIHEGVIIDDMICDFLLDQTGETDIYIINKLRQVLFFIDQQLPTVNQLKKLA